VFYVITLYQFLLILLTYLLFLDRRSLTHSNICRGSAIIVNKLCVNVAGRRAIIQARSSVITNMLRDFYLTLNFCAEYIETLDVPRITPGAIMTTHIDTQARYVQ